MSSAERGLGVQHAPDGLGHFGRFGGRFVPETVMAALDELEAALADALVDPAFQAELLQLGEPAEVGHAGVGELLAADAQRF